MARTRPDYGSWAYWKRYGRIAAILAFLLALRLQLGLSAAGGWNPDIREYVAPSPLAGTLGTIVSIVGISFVLFCIVLGRKPSRRPLRVVRHCSK